MSGILTTLLGLSAAGALALALIARRGRTPGTTPFVCLMLASAVWSVGYGAELSSVEPESAQFWLGFQYLGIPFLGVCWLGMVRELSGESPWSQQTWLTLLAPGILSCLLALTNPYHGWMHVQPQLDTSGPLPLLRFTRGPAYWFTWVYVWASVLAGLGLLWRNGGCRGGLFHQQCWILTLAVAIPSVANVAYMVGWRPWGMLDLTPFSFTLAGAVLAWGVLRVGLFDRVDTARIRVWDQMQEGVLVCDEEAQVLDFNARAREMLGGLRAGQPLETCTGVWPELLEAVRRGVTATIRSGPRPTPFPIIEAVVSPLGTHTCRRGTVTVMRDVTDWVRIQDELHRRQRLLAALAESARTLLQADEKTDYSAFVQILGRAARADRTYIFLNEFRDDGMLCTSLVAEWCAPGISPQIHNPQLQHCAYDEQGLKWWRETLAAGRVIHARVADLPAPERSVLEPQGIKAILCLPLLTDRGFVGFIGLDNCHSEALWDEVEEEYLHNASLNLSLALRRQQSEAALRQALKMEVVVRLAAGVVHDFNNLLQVILGFSEILRDSLPPGHPQRGAVEQILKASQRAAELTAKLLALTQHSPTTTAGCHLHARLDELRPVLTRQLRDNIRLEYRLEATHPAIPLDPAHLEQIVLNLVRNAAEALPAEGGTITLSTRTVEMDAAHGRARGLAPGRYTFLQVEDTGQGMGPEVMAHLFEPFFTTKPFGKGAGLGLAVAQGLVRQYRGCITVQSEPGRGSRFTVYFPVQTHLPNAQAAARSGVICPPQFTLLVVEDDPDVCRLLREILERGGYQVLTAASGQEALQTLRQKAPPVHLVLSDALMPDLSGVALVHQIRKDHPGLPVVLLSGYPEDLIEGRKTLPADVPVLPKPLRPDTLLAKVRDLLPDTPRPEAPPTRT